MTVYNDLLLDIPVTTDPLEGQPTDRQADLMMSLLGELETLDPSAHKAAQQYMLRMNGHWTRGSSGNASRWIDHLIGKIREIKATPSSKELTDGMYLMNGVVYKVQRAIHGSGRLYAKRLLPNSPGERAVFIYAPGVVNVLTPEHKMTMKQAKEWGALYGTCVRCGAVLTAEDSIERMMGPICATKI
jgi:hypothetical protein